MSQLSLLLILKEKTNSKQVYIYDPVFSQEEVNLLTHKLDMKVMEVNEESRHEVNGRVLFFMPHCDKSLFNNLLWSNWDSDKLDKIYIYGNSFHNMLDTIVSERIASQQFSYLYHITHKFDNVLIESVVENDFIDKEIFNDLSIHAFNKQYISDHLLKQCYNNQQPLYNDNESGDLL